MPIKNLTLGLCLLFAGQALAQNSTHTVKKGDTLSALAAKYKTTQKAILQANGLKSQQRLAVGKKIVIPGAVTSTPKRPTTTASAPGTYVVQAGDSDWSLAKKHKTSINDLHKMNSGIDWRNLQIGQKLRVPGVAAAKTVASDGKYVVVQGDNDWTIARKTGLSREKLHALNPGTVWPKIQVGQTLNLSSPPKVAAKPAAPKPVAKAAPAKLNSKYALITVNGTIVRSGPSGSAKQVVKVGAGTRVTVLGRENDWYRLQFPHGSRGWVNISALQATGAPTVVAKKPSRIARNSVPAGGETFELTSMSVVDTAQSFRGVRYRYGGMSRSGTDCSGFTSQVFRKQGVSLPRTSRGQAAVGKPVSGNLIPGDLVFFKTSRGSRISHVGIYVGNNKFIHASSGGGRVQINSLKESYYSRRFATARRVVKTGGGAAVAKKAEEILADPAMAASVPEANPVEVSANSRFQGTDEIAE